jgi:hypothetical protein
MRLGVPNLKGREGIRGRERKRVNGKEENVFKRRRKTEKKGTLRVPSEDPLTRRPPGRKNAEFTKLKWPRKIFSVFPDLIPCVRMVLSKEVDKI